MAKYYNAFVKEQGSKRFVLCDPTTGRKTGNVINTPYYTDLSLLKGIIDSVMWKHPDDAYAIKDNNGKVVYKVNVKEYVVAPYKEHKYYGVNVKVNKSGTVAAGEPMDVLGIANRILMVDDWNNYNVKKSDVRLGNYPEYNRLKGELGISGEPKMWIYKSNFPLLVWHGDLIYIIAPRITR